MENSSQVVYDCYKKDKLKIKVIQKRSKIVQVSNYWNEAISFNYLIEQL